MKNRLTTIETKEVNVMVWEPNQNLTDFGSLLPSKQNDPDKQQDLVMEFVLNNYPNELNLNEKNFYQVHDVIRPDSLIKDYLKVFSG